jgi:hypothetical protein
MAWSKGDREDFVGADGRHPSEIAAVDYVDGGHVKIWRTPAFTIYLISYTSHANQVDHLQIRYRPGFATSRTDPLVGFHTIGRRLHGDCSEFRSAIRQLWLCKCSYFSGCRRLQQSALDRCCHRGGRVWPRARVFGAGCECRGPLFGPLCRDAWPRRDGRSRLEDDMGQFQRETESA